MVPLKELALALVKAFTGLHRLLFGWLIFGIDDLDLGAVADRCAARRMLMLLGLVGLIGFLWRVAFHGFSYEDECFLG